MLLRALDSVSIPATAIFPKGLLSNSPLVLRDLYTSGQLDQALSTLSPREAIDARTGLAGRPAPSGNRHGGNQSSPKTSAWPPAPAPIRACGRPTLVAPAWWDKEKARPLATAKGEALLDAVEAQETLAEALAPHVLTVGTTARTGGGGGADCSRPERAAEEIAPLLHEGNRVAIVFGCEDRGLGNADIEQCQRPATIPTAGDASSAQSLGASHPHPHLRVHEGREPNRSPTRPVPTIPADKSRRITHEEQALLYARSVSTSRFSAIDFLEKRQSRLFPHAPLAGPFSRQIRLAAA